MNVTWKRSTLMSLKLFMSLYQNRTMGKYFGDCSKYHFCYLWILNPRITFFFKIYLLTQITFHFVFTNQEGLWCSFNEEYYTIQAKKQYDGHVLTSRYAKHLHSDSKWHDVFGVQREQGNAAGCQRFQAYCKIQSIFFL
jgi:hypothetical protein